MAIYSNVKTILYTYEYYIRVSLILGEKEWFRISVTQSKYVLHNPESPLILSFIDNQVIIANTEDILQKAAMN